MAAVDLVDFESVQITVTTDGTGAGTAASQRIRGYLYAVEWIDGDFSDGVDGTFTYVSPSGVTKTLLTLTDANVDATYFPRVVVHSEAGAALTGTAGGDRCMPIIDGPVTLTIAQGGATHTGGAILYYKRA